MTTKSSTLRRLGAPVAIAALLCCVLGGQEMLAQTSDNKAARQQEMSERVVAKRAASAALKAGNTAAAVTALTAHRQKWTTSEPEDYEIGRQLAEITFGLRNQGDPVAAARGAPLALSRLQAVETRLAPKEAVVALMLAASVYEHVQGDNPRARQAYERVLVLEPKHAQAQQRRARLVAIEESAKAKAAANLVLVQRAATKGRQ